MRSIRIVIVALGVLARVLALEGAPADSFRFAILGDRTGSAQPGVYEQVWRETAAENPAFVLTVGDIIEGFDDTAATNQWQEVEQMLTPFRRFPLYLVPGNHDIWSAASEALFNRYSGHRPHYSFDHGPAHFTVLDNSRAEEFSAAEMAFLEKDLKEHSAQPIKFIISHQPSWLIDAIFQNHRFPIHQLARKYGVAYVISGHIHQMLHVEMQGVTYLSMPSSGGHLRASKKYEDGWFFAHTLVEVDGKGVHFHVEEVKAPIGRGRVTELPDWGSGGLTDRIQKVSPAPATPQER